MNSKTILIDGNDSNPTITRRIGVLRLVEMGYGSGNTIVQKRNVAKGTAFEGSDQLSKMKSYIQSV